MPVKHEIAVQAGIRNNLYLFIMDEKEFAKQGIVLFDGVCNLCNSSVVFVLQKEKGPVFQFASMQSKAGQELLEWCGLPKEYNQAVILIDRGRAYLGSTAALKIGQQLKFPWSFFAHMGFVVPTFIRDWIYAQIARHRYQWFGKRDVCMVPTRELQSRFVR